ncbi:poly-beta-1,6-N-acetyl-D-glucosamine N-deacetylase PgaB [Modicisalibacter sp. 'Wilcox']|uniref:poly-beta-1,6-N-acetyl-D-glucosamine N-deacetylase PgaB n=1 Tax=Modicisalibacter sp. 'Wilcox' TaxID=2679914 RepID=UPI001F09DE87|nr:poly-beta-1,6-N-acetyl-D-glucosamine N-deacetylase PgaB [Modicisalibacter sp. 'Wilcox']
MKTRLLALLALCLTVALAAPAFAGRQPGDLAVISYHDIVDLDRTPNQKLYPQTITRNKLIQHFNLIAELGYHPVSLQQVLDARDGKQPLPDKAVLLTFDDGYRSFYDIVYPLLELYNYPAVAAIVGSWLDVPPGRQVLYGNDRLPRSHFMTWDQLREMDASGRVEIASHTYALHYGLVGNPFGNQQPAAVTSAWTTQGYEDAAAYRARIREDFRRSQERMRQELGHPARAMVWPYGAYSEATLQMAADAGMPTTFNLISRMDDINEGTRAMGRYLVDQETSLQYLQEILAGKTWDRTTKRIVHVDLDYVYDPDPAQQARNLDRLLDRIKAYGVSTVYLQAFADADGNGVAEALYFPNRHMPVKADLFNRVAWQLKKRADVQVYAWMPVMAFDMGPGYQYVSDLRLGKPNPHNYRRLSPYVAENRRIIDDIYEDLGLYTKFDGLLFHDDGFFSDYEDAGTAALAWYHQKWGLPPGVSLIRQDKALMARWTQHKTRFLIDFTQELARAADRYRLHDEQRLRTARNVYAPVVLDPESRAWFAQDLEAFADAYDYTAVMAMPYMEGAHDDELWLRRLARDALARVPSDKLVFELQATDWRDKSPVPSDTLGRWMQVIREAGVRNYGYYPDDFLNNHPDAGVLRRNFSLTARLGARP